MEDKRNKYSVMQLSDMLSLPVRVVNSWIKSGKVKSSESDGSGSPIFFKEDIQGIAGLEHLTSTAWEKELLAKPLREYKMIELFAGAGGLAIGMEMAGLNAIMLNEIDKHAANTLKENRPKWNVINDDVQNLDFTEYKNEVDILTGGFPCQAFSYAGNKLGFEDTRGTLFFEYARALKEINPKIMVAENVKGLISHDDGKTLKTITKVIDDLGYHLVDPKVLKAINYMVPQKRERLFLVGIRKDLVDTIDFKYPDKNPNLYGVKHALKKGELFDTDCIESPGTKYPKRKKEIMDMVPGGGYWKDLPLAIQKEYMKKSFALSGGKTGMARRLSWDSPSLTITCSPAQKQTERCHPDQTRPLQVREYARIQTFPDDWVFSGPITSQYKQIGNAVPVNLAHAMGRAIVRALNKEYE